MNTVSPYDVQALKKIRQGVSQLIQQAVEEQDRAGVLVLDVAPQDWDSAGTLFKRASVSTLDIEPTSGASYIADLTQNNSATINSGIFDAVILCEVLEHTLQPFAAIDEVYRMLAPGGHLYLSTPLNFRVHGPLPDCWRFTEHGLRALLASFSQVTIHGVESDRLLFPYQYLTVAVK